jgi:hypothetical protein
MGLSFLQPLQPRVGFVENLPRWIQLGVFVIVGFVTVITPLSLALLLFTGVAKQAFYVTVFLAALIALLHLPQVFFRLPKWSQWVCYFFALCSLTLALFMMVQLEKAWSQTLPGIAFNFEQDMIAKGYLKDRDKSEQSIESVSGQQEDHEKQQEEAEQALSDLSDYVKKAESCFTTFGHRLPTFESLVKNSMHNPESFSHIETQLITPDANRNNIRMTFRGQNGFGAIRVGSAVGQLIADGCEIGNVSIDPIN